STVPRVASTRTSGRGPSPPGGSSFTSATPHAAVEVSRASTNTPPAYGSRRHAPPPPHAPPAPHLPQAWNGVPSQWTVSGGEQVVTKRITSGHGRVTSSPHRELRRTSQFAWRIDDHPTAGLGPAG